MTEYGPRGLAPSNRDSSYNTWLLKFSLAMKYSHIEKLKCCADRGVKKDTFINILLIGGWSSDKRKCGGDGGGGCWPMLILF